MNYIARYTLSFKHATTNRTLVSSLKKSAIEQKLMLNPASPVQRTQHVQNVLWRSLHAQLELPPC